VEEVIADKLQDDFSAGTRVRRSVFERKQLTRFPAVAFLLLIFIPVCSEFSKSFFDKNSVLNVYKNPSHQTKRNNF
jgi:hypothetical protein